MSDSAGLNDRITTPLVSKWTALAEELELPSDAQTKVTNGLSELRAHHIPTYEHCMRVGIVAVKIGEVEGLPRKPLFYAGSSHDRGKIFVPATLLGKTSGWTRDDAEVLKDHPLDGYEMIMNDGMALTAGIVVLHHTFQPNAYPEEIPELGPILPEHLKVFIKRLGRIVALSDFYDAAHRPNSAGGLSAGQIKDKILTHNADVSDLIEKLYDLGVFNADYQHA